ncbi:ATP-dependent helicase HrpB [soil metagenome]
MLSPLPIDPFIAGIADHLQTSRAVVVTAAPGAGKTTRVGPALAVDGPVILLQPRRVAARSLARRIAEEQGWALGQEVGWHVRFERQFAPDTRLLLATEGILTARLQQDPLLSGFRTIILDEFHERSIHADLGIALAKQAWRARDDLRLVIMSATMDTARVAAFLDGCPIVDVPGRAHPLDIAYRPGMTLAAAVGEVLAATPGQVLCFLPGAPEIRRAMPDVAAVASGFRWKDSDIEVVELHGSLEPAEQDRAVAPATGRRVILATIIAETSLTVAGITAVVDSGVHKVARYDPDRAIDRLEMERISRDSADQRAGRAGRLGPGLVRRLWHEADRLRPHREPDIHRVDLSGPLLDVIAWGGDPRRMDWFDPPAAEALAAGLELLERLGAIAGAALTPLGRRMHRLPLHPRLARILIAGEGSRAVALACALLSERHFLAPRPATTTSDLLSAVENERGLPPQVVRVAGELRRMAASSRGADALSTPSKAGASGMPAPGAAQDESAFRRALLQGYPDRVGKRRAPGSPRVLLASGHGAVIGPESGVRDGDYLVALDVQAGRRGEGSEARIRLASTVDGDWLAPTATRIEHEYDAQAGKVRAFTRDYYGELVLTEATATPDAAAAAALVASAYLSRGLPDEDELLVRRLRFAGIAVNPVDLVTAAAAGCRSIAEVDLVRDLPWDVRQALERHAPERLPVPSGRTHRLDYHADGSVSASVKLQELFGLAETPRIGPAAEPVRLMLLAPNGRPVQTTRDLRSFWERTYPEVRKELRGRYPRHPWPEDPWTATPTARTSRRT